MWTPWPYHVWRIKDELGEDITLGKGISGNVVKGVMEPLLPISKGKFFVALKFPPKGLWVCQC